MNYQNLVSEADNTDLGFDNSRYHAQPHPIIVYYLKTLKLSFNDFLPFDFIYRTM